MKRPIYRILEFSGRALPRLNGMWWSLITGLGFRRVGRHFKLRGLEAIHVEGSLAIGDACWIEAVTHYKGRNFSPALSFGQGVSISDWTHISCADSVEIGAGCLLGSKIYIGDHSHGAVPDYAVAPGVNPADRPLGDLSPITIGARCWICDGAVILGGTRIAAGSIVGANSVVKLVETRPAVIAGVPARVVRYLDETEHLHV